MKKIKAGLYDADGVLITGGKFESTPAELKEAIAELRESGVLFNLASGRPLFEQEQLFRIITNNAAAKPLEGILYEASAVKLWGSGQIYKVGGLTPEQIDLVECFVIREGLFQEMVPQQNQSRYDTQRGFVTPGFRLKKDGKSFLFGKGETDKQLLEAVYNRVKPVIEREFSFAEVEMSADAVDIRAKGVSKDKPILEYARVTGIRLDEMAAIGDSGSDMAMLREVARASGLVSYVGEKEEHITELTNFGDRFINTTKPGPFGAVEFVKAILNYNDHQI